VSFDAAPAASFSPLFGKTLRHQLLTYPASAQTTIWCKKRAKINHTECFAAQSPLKKGLRPQRQELIHPCEQAYEKDVGGEMWPHFFRPRMRVMALVFAGMAIRTTITAAETRSDSRS
jgi:hypothetical protein